MITIANLLYQLGRCVIAEPFRQPVLERSLNIDVESLAQSIAGQNIENGHLVVFERLLIDWIQLLYLDNRLQWVQNGIQEMNGQPGNVWDCPTTSCRRNRRSDQYLSLTALPLDRVVRAKSPIARRDGNMTRSQTRKLERISLAEIGRRGANEPSFSAIRPRLSGPVHRLLAALKTG